MKEPSQAVLDTSVLIARENGRPLDSGTLPDELAVSIVTVAELHVGVHLARDIETRARRLGTLADLVDVEVLYVDDDVATQWSVMRATLGERRRKVNVNDLWIAATALAHGIPVVTQDADFDALDGIGGLRVVRV